MNLRTAYDSFIGSMVGVLSPRTVEWYAERLRALVDTLGDREISVVTIAELRAWRRALIERDTRWSDNPHRPTEAGKLSPHTIAGHIRACRRFFAWLVEEGDIEYNPAKRLEMPRLPDTDPKAITAEDLGAILDAAHDNPRDYAIVLFLADTGCRLAGIAGLRIQDLDLKRAEAIVWEKGAGGNGKSRIVYFGERTATALCRYLEIRPTTESDRVWIGTRGPLSKWGIYHVLRRLAEKAGVEGRWNPHAFRHGWARHALRAGADLGTISQILGHSDIVVTHRSYGRWANRELGERARRFSPVNGADSPTDF